MSPQYLVFDEHVLQRMVQRGWVRQHGASKLLPLAVGCFEDWQQRPVRKKPLLVSGAAVAAAVVAAEEAPTAPTEALP